METQSPTARLCLAGTTAEFERRLDDARALYAQAWDAAADDLDRAVAAHYIGHLETDPDSALRWHLTALESAQKDQRGLELMGSLLVCVGGAYEALGHVDEAESYFALAAEHGVNHQRD